MTSPPPAEVVMYFNKSEVPHQLTFGEALALCCEGLRSGGWGKGELHLPLTA